MKRITYGIASILLSLCLILGMTAPAFAADETERRIAAESNCFTSGAYGSAESSGNIGADVREVVGNEAQDAGEGLCYTRTFEKVTDAVRWTLKDGVLTLSGSGVVAKRLDLVFGGNEHIETLVVEEGITQFTDSVSDLPNLKTVIVMDGSIQATLFSNCPNVETVIVGANLKDSMYSGFTGKSGEHSGDMADKFIILTKNVGRNYRGALLRSDFNGYSNGKLCVQDGERLNNYASLSFHKDDIVTADYATLLNMARAALADVPEFVRATLPAELTAPPQEEPIVDDTESVGTDDTERPETGTQGALTDGFVNSESRIRTSYNEDNYLDISVSGSTLTVSGRLLVDGLSAVSINCGGESVRVNVSDGEPFSAELALKHSGYSAVGVYLYRNGSSGGQGYAYNRILVEKTSGGYRIMPSLVQETNTAFEQTYIDPQAALDAANVPETVAAKSREIVGSETDDYTKVFLLHKWVAENIYYDYVAYSNTSLRSTDSAVILETARGVCAGYSMLLRDLVLAQGIPAIYSTNDSLNSSYALRNDGGEDHAHTEAYVDGRWITMDATWDSNNEYRGGTYTAKEPTGYYYFDISSEAFAMDHKITGRGGKRYVVGADGFGIDPTDGSLKAYEGDGGDIVIPDGVTSIAWRAFYENKNVTSVTVPASVTSIGEDAFAYCANLERVTLSNGITAIPNSAFADCPKLKSVVIPNGVTSIGDWAFSGCTALESVVIPDSVTSIGTVAFNDCTSLAEVYIPGSVVFTYDDQSIFLGCEGLKSVTFGEGITAIPVSMFYGCKSLVSVTIPDSVTTVWGEAFRGCTALESIFIPESVTSIGIGAFRACTALTSVVYGGTEAQWAAVKVERDNDQLTKTVIRCSDNSGFVDVPADAYYAEAVMWAVKNGITNGTSATEFSPDDTCTNAHILTFLWRAAGKPQANGASVFAGDPADMYYSEAARWAGSLGMAEGAALSADAPCTRASTVMFMWQAAGCPSANVNVDFTDVPADADYAMAVAWALENGITNGTSATEFSPDEICSRGQIVTLLYRAFAE